VNVDVEQLRVKVYRTFAQTGRPPTVDELADEVAGETTEVRAALRHWPGPGTCPSTSMTPS